MLLSPYAVVLGISTTPLFIAVTFAAHAIFGAVLGLTLQLTLGTSLEALSPLPE